MIIVPHESPNQIANITRDGCDIFGIEDVPKSENECSKIVGRMSNILDEVPYPSGQVDAELIKGRYLAAVGVVFALVISKAFGWHFCELRKENERREDSVNAVVSPDQSYFVFPIGVVYKEAHRHGDECWRVYEKIKTGNLPDVLRGSFFEITA